MTKGGLNARPLMMGRMYELHSMDRSLYWPSMPQPIEIEKKSSKGILGKKWIDGEKTSLPHLVYPKKPNNYTILYDILYKIL